MKAEGVTLGELDVGERVGEGVSGHVLSAIHRATGTRLAVKVYPFGSIDPAFRPRERFWRECRILSRLEHPAFPTLYGCGELDEKTGFAAMEWIQGPSLDSYREAPLDQVLRLSVKVALALRALHRVGFVHRDIAFDNFLVEERRSGLNPRVIDLGVAKEIDGDELTLPGSFLGRLGFAAPEGLTERGSAAIVDPKADVFSFGVLLYEWLTGTPPFPGETPRDVMRSQRRRLPERLPEPEKRPPVPDELGAFVLALLERDPARRPPMELVVKQLLDLRRQLGPAKVPPVLSDPAAHVHLDEELGYALLERSFPARPPLLPVRDLATPRPEASRDAELSEPAPGGTPEPANAVEDAFLQVGTHPIWSTVFVGVSVLAFAVACISVYLFVWKR